MNTLKAETRTMDTKAKRLRREGYVTGNVFGKEIEGSLPVKIERSNVEKLLKTSNKGSQIMLDVDGQSYDVLIKEIQFNPLKGNRIFEKVKKLKYLKDQFRWEEATRSCHGLECVGSRIEQQC